MSKMEDPTNKAILLLNMPDCCNNCPLCDYSDMSDNYPAYRLCNGMFDDYEPIEVSDSIERVPRPDWCPLKMLPREYGLKYDNELDIWCDYPENGFEQGWNDCLDTIIYE